MDLKECNVSLIMLCEKYFLLVDGGLIQVYNYEGRMQCLLKLPSMSVSGEAASAKTVAISNDTNDIIEIAINQCGSANDRKLALIDKCLDCFLIDVKTYYICQKIAKIGAMVTGILFNDQTNMLAGLQDNRLVVWLYPSAAFIDHDLLRKTVFESDESNFGKSSYLHNFVGSHISVRRSDGALIPCTVTPFAIALNSFITANKWDQAIRLCRHVQEKHLWGMLAMIATDMKNFHAAEIAYGALDEIEKVKFLSDLRLQQNSEIRSAMLAAFTGNFREADAMLMHNKHIFRAIMLNISLFRWQRALELAIKYKTHLETVIGYRQRYLQETRREEIDPNFLRYQSEVDVMLDEVRRGGLTSREVALEEPRHFLQAL
ncbi:unnamed protein product, partial [Litomosoides sigmodontis]